MSNRPSTIAFVSAALVLVAAGCSRVAEETLNATDLCSADRGYVQNFDDPLEGDAVSLVRFPNDYNLTLKSAKYTIEVGKPVRGRYDRPNMEAVVAGWNPQRMCFRLQYDFLSRPWYGFQSKGPERPELRISEVIAPNSQTYWPFQAMEQDQVALFVDSGVPWSWRVEKAKHRLDPSRKGPEVFSAVRFVLAFDRNGIMGPVVLDQDSIEGGRSAFHHDNWSVRFPYVHAKYPDTMFAEIEGGTGQYNEESKIYEESMLPWIHGSEDRDFSKRKTKIVIQQDPNRRGVQTVVIRSETTMFAYVIFDPYETKDRVWVTVSAPHRIISELEYFRH